MYKVGDKVTVRSVQELLRDGCERREFESEVYYIPKGFRGAVFREEMKRYSNNDYYIEVVCSDGKYLLEDSVGAHVSWFWEDYMLKSAVEKSLDVASESDIDCLYD